MSWEMLNVYAQQDPRWYESLQQRPAGPEFLALHRRHVPADWTLGQRGPWFLVEPPDADRSQQGWKLHLSSLLDTAAPLLDVVLPVLVEHRVRFKYLLDHHWLARTCDKRWSRGSSGKFVTVYPASDDAFRLLAKDLVEATHGFRGPHILSDRPVPGSQCLYYRYGGFAAIKQMQADGAPALMVHAPDGTPVPDLRLPYYSAPEWTTDPFGEPEPDPAVPTLCDGRFSVTGALAFTNSGGVYLAIDASDGASVVLKEARPGVLVGRSRTDATEVLAREHRILQRLADVPHVVRARALFREGEHVFLAEDKVAGGQVSTRGIATHPVNTVDRAPGAIRRHLAAQRGWWLEVLEVIEGAHRRGVVLADLSFTNILEAEATDSAATDSATTDGDRRRSITVIDLEAAIDEGVDASLGLSTPGVSAPRARHRDEVDRAGDYHALGALILGSVMLVNSAVGRSRALLPGFLAALDTDLALPAGLTTLIAELMDPDADPNGPDPAAVRDRIEALDLSEPAADAPTPALWHPPTAPTPTDRAAVADTLRATLATIVASATPLRADRLFPGHPYQYQTNPWSVAYGAAGVLHVLATTAGPAAQPATVPPPSSTAVQRALTSGSAWLLRADITPHTAPPGLYVGRAGIAWVLDELGQHDHAAALVHAAVDDPLLATDHSMLQGGAGVGTALLRRWRDHDDPIALAGARRCGERLAAAAVRDDAGHAHWPGAGGPVPVGYARGASGIATFLLALGVATGEDRWYALGRAGLAHDLAQAYTLPSGLVSFPTTVVEPGATPAVVRAYWDEGTAGVATALIRYHAVSPEPELADMWETLRTDIARSYAVMPQLFHGLSGLGMALLDAAELLDDDLAHVEAWRTARGVLRFASPVADGIAFPGEQCLRDSVDLATGSAGVALFLHRLLRTGPGLRTNHNFMLDDVLLEPVR